MTYQSDDVTDTVILYRENDAYAWRRENEHGKRISGEGGFKIFAEAKAAALANNYDYRNPVHFLDETEE